MGLGRANRRMKEPDNSAVERSIEIALAEFSALRKEIGERAGAQDRYIALGLTLASTIGGVVVTHTSTRPLLLVPLLVGPLLGLLFLDHAFTVDALGNYIRLELADSLRHSVRKLNVGGRLADSDINRLLAWEEGVLRARKRVVWRVALLGGSLLPFALAPGVAAFLVQNTNNALSPVVYWALWTMGVALVLSFIGLWIAWATAARKMRRASR